MDQIENTLTKMDVTIGPLLADLRTRVRGLTRNADDAAEHLSSVEEELGIGAVPPPGAS